MVPKKSDQAAVRTQVVTVRLNPRLKYFAELAARKQYRTLSSYIEWAIEQSLKEVQLKDELTGRDVSLLDAKYLWDIDEPDRLASLAFHFPDLLTPEEETIWKLISTCGLLWKGSFGGRNSEWRWEVKPTGLIFDRLREHWQTFKDVASGAKPSESLPSWEKIDPNPIPF